MSARLELYRTHVPPEWVDYNGHMNDACYCIAFSRTTDALIDYIGLDATARERQQCSVYTLENHLCYLGEARQDDKLRVTTQLLGHDGKRLRVFHALFRQGEDSVLATSEQMLLHVDSRGPKAAPFVPPVADQVARLAREHAELPAPEQAGRRIMTLTNRPTLTLG